MFSSRWTRLALACVMCTLPGLAHAQTGETNTRVFSSLFGGATNGQYGVQALDFNAALFGGYDDDLLARGSNRPRTVDQRLSGAFLGAQASLNYRRRLVRGNFSASARTSYRYLPDIQEVLPTYHAASLSYGFAVSPRTSVSFSQRVAYRPFFSVVPFATGSTIGPSVESDVDGDPLVVPEDVVTDPGGDFSLASDRDAVTYGGTAVLVREISRRSRLQFSARYATARFLSSDVEQYNNFRWGVSGAYTYRISEYLGARLGYGYRRFEARTGDDADNHDINVGIDYGQPFVFGRGRTRLAFTTGSTMLVRERVDSAGNSRNRFVWRALGTATLSHDFVGPWQAQLSYIRTVGFLDGLTDPFTGDRIIASLGGLIGMRTDLYVSAGYLSGAFGLRDRNFDTAVAGARIRTALTRHLALFAQYFYYQYHFDDRAAEDVFLPAAQERQGIRAGLTVWVPLMR